MNALWLLLACDDHIFGSPDPGKAALDGSDGSGGTWSEDVAPIVERSCVGCHRVGGVGRGDFTSYASAAPLAPAMAAFVNAHSMPPPSMDPGCRPYVGHERMVLSDDERAIIQAWSDAGAPEGSAHAPLSFEDPELARVDAELILPVSHEVSPAADGNEYHCQILSNPFDDTTYVTGFDVLVDQPSVVHHTVLAIDQSGDAGESSGDRDLSDGWDCSASITEPDWSILHAWAPGMEPTAFADGLGLRIEPGEQLVLQMHYFGEADGTVDQSGYRLSTTSRVDTELHMEPVGPTRFSLPADAITSPEETMVNDYGVTVTLYGVFPHMHMLATSYSSRIESGNGETCLAGADAWDFGHQATYLYEEPVDWLPGETLVSTCTYDNTAQNPNQYNSPPQTVSYGEGTNQEMCFFLYYYSY